MERKIIFELKTTYYCNLSCNFCVFSKRKKGKSFITDKEIEIIFHSIHKKYPKVDYFIYSGGEPTIRPNFKKIFSTVQDVIKPKETIVHTNGIKINKLLSAKNDFAINFSVFYSFHTINPKTHYRFTNSNKFATIKSNLLKLINNGVTVFTNTVVMKPNQHEIEQIGDFLAKSRVKAMEFRFPFGTESLIKKNPWILPDNFISIEKQLARLITKYSDTIDIFIHPSVPCLMKTVNTFNDEESIKLIEDQSKLIFKKNVDFYNKKNRFIFLDTRMRIITGNTQQGAINKGEDIFTRISSCRSCIYKNLCLGIPKEFLIK
ncbi:radical SAM protein [Candidatus Microgenomates bacterium]|jgi:MoaA/NifB/PqqE/SkfB family radical SAM enzyme|nr:MAG: radical SAM protein [Candidatus Microgenomates bacterium]